MTPAATINIASHLAVMARRQPDAPAVIEIISGAGAPIRDIRRTCGELDRASDCIARGLAAIGIRRGMRVALCVRPGLDFFDITFAFFKMGAVPVLIDPGIGLRNFGRCLADAMPEAFIGLPIAHALRRILGWARKTNRINISTGWFGGHALAKIREVGLRETESSDARSRAGELSAGELSSTESSAAAPIMVDSAPADPAAILFTSGSTGPPKGVVYTHGNFDAQVRALRDLYDIQPGELDLATFPLFGLFGPALGMTAIIPRMDFTRPGQVDPRNIIEPIRHYSITNVFGSPALLDRVGEWGAGRGIKLPTLQRVISAGAPVPARVIERFETLLSSQAGLLKSSASFSLNALTPALSRVQERESARVQDRESARVQERESARVQERESARVQERESERPAAQIHTPYGATESLPVSSIASAEILRETRQLTDVGKGICVGRPAPGMRVRIIRISDDPIPEWSDDLELSTGQIGEIAVQGAVVTAEYFSRPDATRLAKIIDPAGGFYHRMGDVGYFDEIGRLWFCGRKSQRVRLPDGDLFSMPVEGIFNTHPAVYRSALVGVSRGGITQPVICIELLSGVQRSQHESIRSELLALAGKHATTRSIKAILFHPRFPVDIRHNAKIGREKLAIWAERRLP